MTSPQILTTLSDDIAKNMLQFFEGWDAQVPHQAEKGGVRERRVRDFLGKFLPRRYGVASGHIVDRKGVFSLQEDIVIFDQLDSPILTVDPYYQVFPCEMVYATIEVKSFLKEKEIEKCISHAYQLRQLHRGNLGPIESFVFAYDSYDAKDTLPVVWARDKFREIAFSGAEQKPMPSIVLCLKKRFMLHLGMDQSEHIADTLESGILLYFLEGLLDRISRVKTSSPLLFKEYGWWDRHNPIMRCRSSKELKSGNYPLHKLKFTRIDLSRSRPPYQESSE